MIQGTGTAAKTISFYPDESVDFKVHMERWAAAGLMDTWLS
jgi:hypothetical protein